MEAVSKIFLHAEKRYANGHILVACAIIYRGVAIPYGIKIWVGKNSFSNLAMKYGWTNRQTINELAAELIRSLDVPKKTKVTVVFDKYYLNQKVVKACNEMGFRYIGAVKSNRLFTIAGSKKNTIKIGSHIVGLMRWHGKYTPIKGSILLHKLASNFGYISKIGLVKIVCSQRKGETKILTLVTNDTSLSPEEVVTMYRNRWDIEILFKTSKQYLGLGDYQLLQYQAIEKYLHLVLCAHCLLTRQAYIMADEKEKEIRSKTLIRIGVYKAKIMFQNTIVNDCLDSTFNNKRYESQSRRFVEKIRRTFTGENTFDFIYSI